MPGDVDSNRKYCLNRISLVDVNFSVPVQLLSLTNPYGPCVNTGKVEVRDNEEACKCTFEDIRGWISR